MLTSSPHARVPSDRAWLRRIEKALGRDWLELKIAAHAPGASRSVHYVDIAALSIFALLVFGATGVWYIGSDDAGYITAAHGWIEHFPYVSSFFGDLRHPTIIP